MPSAVNSAETKGAKAMAGSISATLIFVTPRMLKPSARIISDPAADISAIMVSVR